MEEENLYPTDEEMHNNANLMATLVDQKNWYFVYFMTKEELIYFIRYLENHLKKLLINKLEKKHNIT